MLKCVYIVNLGIIDNVSGYGYGDDVDGIGEVGGEYGYCVCCYVVQNDCVFIVDDDEVEVGGECYVKSCEKERGGVGECIGLGKVGVEVCFVDDLEKFDW